MPVTFTIAEDRRLSLIELAYRHHQPTPGNWFVPRPLALEHGYSEAEIREAYAALDDAYHHLVAHGTPCDLGNVRNWARVYERAIQLLREGRI